MVLFNYSTKEITAKIVYYGPGLCGKTTNLQFVYENLPASINKGKMLSLATKTDRTLFFDFLPIDLGTIRGMRTRLQLYTVPGQVFYNTTRKLVLKGADGVVFVADSQRRMMSANTESFSNLEENLAEHDMSLREIPVVIQFNKRDLPEVAPVEELNASLNKFNAPIYEAVATTGIGVHETLRAITRLVLNSLKERYQERKETRPAVSPAKPASVRAALTPAADSTRPGRAAPPERRATVSPVASPSGPPLRGVAEQGRAAGAMRAEVVPAATAETAVSHGAPSDLFVLEEMDDLEERATVSAGARPPAATRELAEAPGAATADELLELATGEERLIESEDETELDLEEIVEVTGSAPAVPSLPGARPTERPSPAGDLEGTGDLLDTDDAVEVDDLLEPEATLQEAPDVELGAIPLAPEEDAGVEATPVGLEAGLAAASPEIEAEPDEEFVVLDDERHDDRMPADEKAPVQVSFQQDRANLVLGGIGGARSVHKPSPTPQAARIVAPAARLTPEGLQEILLPIHLGIGGRQIAFNLRITLDLASAHLEDAGGGREADTDPRR